MTDIQRMKMLEVPKGIVDVVIDTDTYNEIDDQFAVSYMLRSEERMRVKALYAAPFYNHHSSGPADGMERSYQEILTLLKLADRRDLEEVTFRGSECYLPDEKTPVESAAARDLAERAMAYTPENPLYVVTVGAITNVASAILMKPEICDRIVISWLGGNSLEWPHTREFNLRQDIAAARVVFGCGAPVVQLPCMGVVSAFSTSQPELEYWLRGKNALCDYLIDSTVAEANRYAEGKVWTRIIWDVTAVAWLLNDDDRFMNSKLIPALIPQYDDHYSQDPRRHLMRYVYNINRDELFRDLFAKLAK